MTSHPAHAGRPGDRAQRLRGSSQVEQASLYEARQEVLDRAWLPARILAGRIVKAETMLAEGRISPGESNWRRRYWLILAESQGLRPQVWQAVRELRWIGQQGEPGTQTVYARAAGLFGLETPKRQRESVRDRRNTRAAVLRMERSERVLSGRAR